MTTDTQLAPTYPDLKALIDKEMGEYSDGAYADHGSARSQLEHFARSVLAHGGKSYGAGEVDRADAVNLARNCLGAYNCVITKKGMRVLAEAVLAMDAALSTPQPTQAQAEPISGAKSFQTHGEANAYSKGYYAGKKAATQAQAQAGAVPLTDEQIEAAAPEYSVDDFLDFNAGVRFAERHHGIKGGQHGTDT